MLTKKDICLIMATYNRPGDINRTLNNLIETDNKFGKIIIVDQSKDNKTKKIVHYYKKRLNIRHIRANIPSADISMNIGIKIARKKFKLILTAGDDVDFLKGYADEIINEFNTYPEVMAIGGKEIIQDKDIKFNSKILDFIFKIFFLPFKEDHKFRITGPYGHTTSVVINRPIRDIQWIPGCNMCAKSEVYQNYLWPEIKGYNVIDDIDSSYRIYKKYGKGSLIITPKCIVNHRHSQKARYDDKKRIFVNHEDHFSFYYMHFNNFSGTIKIILSLIGIIIGNLIICLLKPKKENLLILKYNIQGILYAYKHRQDIKNKNFRTFLNDDLSMKI